MRHSDHKSNLTLSDPVSTDLISSALIGCRHRSCAVKWPSLCGYNQSWHTQSRWIEVIWYYIRRGNVRLVIRTRVYWPEKDLSGRIFIANPNTLSGSSLSIWVKWNSTCEHASTNHQTTLIIQFNISIYNLYIISHNGWIRGTKSTQSIEQHLQITWWHQSWNKII